MTWLAAAMATLPDTAQATLVYRRPATQQIVVSADNGTHAHAIAHGRCPSISPNGRRLVFIDTRGNLRLIGARGGRTRLLWPTPTFCGPGPPGPSFAPHWSPNGRYIFFSDANSGGAEVVDARNWRRRELAAPTGGLSFSPRSDRVALEALGPRSTSVVFYATGGRLLGSPGLGEAPVWGRAGIAFQRDGDLVFTPRPGVRPRVLLSRSVVPTLYPVGWSCDGRRLLVVQGIASAHDEDFPRTFIFDLATSSVTRVPQTFREVDAFSRDGRSVLGVVRGNVVAVSSTGAMRVLARHAGNPSWNA